MSTSKVARRTLAPVQCERARQPRNTATPAERKLWQHFRASTQDGHKFSRQIAIGPYIADLVCRRAMLVIELDGSQHNDDVDAARTRFLEAEGFVVLRFWNAQVLTDIDSVLQTILARLGEIPARPKPPPPAPPASGRGAESAEPENKVVGEC